MGSVGSIEKVMVGGILAIILLILAVAINGGQDDGTLDPYASAGEDPSLPLNRRTPDDDGGGVGVDPPNLVKNVPGPGERVDDNFEPAPPAPDPTPAPLDLRPRTYTVKSGDTFGTIAERMLGSSRYLADLQKANEDVDPRKMQIGMILNLPAVGRLSPSGGDDVVREDSVSEGDRIAPPPAKPVASDRIHVVEKGDTLYGISRKHYDTVGRWKEILAANQDVLSKPEELKAGMKLRIP